MRERSQAIWHGVKAASYRRRLALKVSLRAGVGSGDTFATEEFDPVDSRSPRRSNYERGVILRGQAGGVMRRISVLAGLILVIASAAVAQTNEIQSWNLSSVSVAPSPAAAIPSSVPSSSLSMPGGLAASSPINLAADSGPEPQEVQGVFVQYQWQAYFGYTFVKFYEAPGVSPDSNGFNHSVQYYHKNWPSADGEFVGTHLTQNGQRGWFQFGGGGPRFRWSLARGVEL